MNKYLIIGILVVVLVIGLIAYKQSNQETTPNSISHPTQQKALTPIDKITHGHGLAVDVADSKKLYIATHHGLLLIENEKNLYRVGDREDDYMGFSPHPTNPKVFFTSGHPSLGGNLGFQKSEDAGFTWKKISDGLNGPVDFHAMTISPVNHSLIFGWYQGAIQRSTDEGKTWEIVSYTDFPVVGLTADSKDESIVYAASPQGLYVSRNMGGQWENLIEGFVSSVAVHPLDAESLISYSEKNKLALSNDRGKTWQKTNAEFSGQTPLYIAISRQNPEIVYLLTEKNSIYKSINGGGAWSKIY